MNLSILPILLAANKYRIINYDFPPLISGVATNVLICLALIVVSVALGILMAKALRLRDYGWKIGLILSTMTVATFVMLFGNFKLGVDLKGGVILVYEVNEIETKQIRRGPGADTWDMGQLIAVITKRLNPTGLSEIVVRPFGPKQVEIVVPEVDPAEIELIKEKIRTGGVLQFMVVASDERDSGVFDDAKTQAEKPGEERLYRAVMDSTGRQVGYWAKLARDQGNPETAPFRALDTLANGYLRDSRTGEILDLTPQQKRSFAGDQSFLESFLKQRGTTSLDVLMVYDQDFAVRGDDLALAYPGHDESFRPAIHFTMTTDGSIKMGHVTQDNLHRKLAIIFDNELLSAPVIQSKISDNGQITGNFTQEEVDFIVGILKSGSMPVVMQENPISENQIGSILGMDTIIKGSYAVVWSLVLVLAFTWAYYRFAGFVACCALILNLVLTLAIMIMFQAPLTLPGLAGLVLTVGMSVDSNVLIFERIREELSRGAALRMAIRNGFDRAMVTIIDSNLTTLLTAFVLYFIGTDQVKGFGVTLILGILTSMYTAIFCARTVFDIGERSKWLKTLRMTHFLTNPKVDWVKLFAPATVGSVIIILIGLVATVARGKGLFDIDLAGGTSVTFILDEAMPVEDVRSRLQKTLENVTDEKGTKVQFNAYELSLTGEAERPQTVYKVDSSLEKIDTLKAKVREAFRAPDGKDLLKTYHLSVATVEEAPLEKPATAPVLSAPGAVPPAQPVAGEKAATSAPQAEIKAASPEPKTPESKSPEPKTPESKTDEKPAAAEPKADEKAAEPATPKPESPKTDAKSDEKSGGCGEETELQEVTQPEPKADAKTDSPATPAAASPAPAPAPAADKPAGSIADQPATSPTVQPAAEHAAATKSKTVAELNFPGSPISAASLKARIQEAAKSVVNQDLSNIDVDNLKWDRKDNSTFEHWKVTLPVSVDEARSIFSRLEKDLQNAVVWQTSSEIGGQVSADTRWRAVGAIVVSLVGIVLYMWFRFQKAVWGIAAVVALAHDALVMLGGIAVSYWLVGALGFAGVEEFKISLPVVAAFLTLIGFSVNDTIVIFDRVREIRGKSPHLTRQMLNDAVNLTMSRTILTSGTVFIVVTVLYFFGGPGIHAFAFSLVIGVISGTYSTVFIAAPLLLWMFSREQAAASPAAGRVASRDTRKSVA